ncbi:MAG: bifunctional 5,10-methylene-tetrahydrofolate dehydrogenase/5,10-methylene-tetrahydrofolate cyclohydrolase [Sphingomonadales bacterium]|nr:bifunctional 5,10-methylene-tetrahydrofolate dehydrogenase/5,10-methylene-tetrahydrofolate cyclohydrolase [Sphingomonadales bacterium]
MNILDGKIAAEAVKAALKVQVAERAAAGKKIPHLAAILVGNNGASATYVAAKVKACEQTGFISTLIRLEETVTQQKLLETIKGLNQDPDVDGILVQLPLPAQISEQEVIDAIDPLKDVDGFHPVNVGKMVLGVEGFVPATPLGIMLLLAHYNINTSGLHAVVIGRSNIVGRPMSILLSGNAQPGNCTVTLCHSKTKELTTHCQQADLIVAALGKPLFLKADMVKEGAIVIDVGITRIDDATRKNGFRLLGDVEYETVAPKCSWITPVPGGVGPMTIAALMKNTFLACSRK